jgi:hypothetical protein
MSASSPVDPNNCALNAQEKPKYASEIQFYDSKGDHTPISIFVYLRQSCCQPIFKEYVAWL